MISNDLIEEDVDEEARNDSGIVPAPVNSVSKDEEELPSTNNESNDKGEIQKIVIG